MTLLQAAAFLFCVAGFHGLFFYTDPVKKTLSWVAFQSGLILFLLGLSASGVVLPQVLALLIAAVTLAVGLVLVLFYRKSWKPKDETLKRGGR